MDKDSMMESEDRIEKTVDIYISAEAVRDMKHKKDTEDFDTRTSKTQTTQHTGSDCVRIRSSRAAPVCLVLLCVLLLTAVIVLSVYIHTKSTNYTEERDQLLNKITNITEVRDQLTSKNENLTNERVQLILKNKNLTNERVQLILKNKNLTNERVQLRNNLQICDRSINGNKKLTAELVLITTGWTCYQSSLYYISNDMKNWTESRRYCTERGADLIIINNKEEKDFVKNMSGAAVVYIGLTDSDVENTWKWVDGSNMTSGFWASNEPNGGRTENCVVTVAVPKLPEWPGLVGWLDVACNIDYQWICEKNISQLLLP